MSDALQLQFPAPPRKVRMGAVALSVGRPEEFLACYAGAVQRGRGGVIFAPDVSLLRRAQDDPRLIAAFEQALFAVNDGAPVAAMAATLSGVRTPRYRGADFMREAFRILPGTRHFLLGGVESALQALAGEAEKIPGFTLAGIYAPPFQPLEQMDFDGMAERIRAAGAQMVWVFLGNPKQELFCIEMSKRLPTVMFAAVGAALNYLVQDGFEAPPLVRKLWLEWAWRLYREPRRLWRRYAATVPQGLWLLARATLTACGRAMRGGRNRHLFDGAAA